MCKVSPEWPKIDFFKKDFFKNFVITFFWICCQRKCHIIAFAGSAKFFAIAFLVFLFLFFSLVAFFASTAKSLVANVSWFISLKTVCAKKIPLVVTRDTCGILLSLFTLTSIHGIWKSTKRWQEIQESKEGEIKVLVKKSKENKRKKEETDRCSKWK